ncbi:MFS transporter [Demequina sp. SYSU T00039]|uniref:MFS transporter n=1 Tax=Demequina lignilytica TaxID=3051663 RepID=A0AAW7M0I3_9MICO|nr:MFS transporter [Demequina sp. SYSU T00039]MDN4486639.1 MFS transporter [Demequina sp. SYSU T00039]
MSDLSPARTRLALLALALGGFAIGATEFVAMGLLPEIARDLLPDLAGEEPEAAIARAGLLISAYAAGVVVGAPTIAAFAARLPRTRLLMALAAAFTLATLASAVAPTFGTVVAARFVAGLPHGAYFGVAALVAAQLMGPGRRGQAVAYVLSGLAIANVVGVPLITALGQQAGWRIAYVVVAALFGATLLAIALLVPRVPGDPQATVRSELRAFRRPAVWLALGTGALGFGGFFAVYSYISPLATEVTGTASGLVPLVLVVVGLGMTAGNAWGGRLADGGAVRAIFILFAAFAGSLVLLALTASHPAGLFVGGFLVGGSAAALSPAIQTRLMDVAGDSQTIAAAVNHSSLNLGNSLGAALGGAVIAAGWGYVAPTWLGLALCVPGVLLAWAGAALTARSARREALPSTARVPVGAR